MPEIETAGLPAKEIQTMLNKSRFAISLALAFAA
jgi:hypothetical protein